MEEVLVAGNLKKIKELTQFDNVQEWDPYIKRLKYHFKSKLTPSAMNLIQRFSGFVKKMIGAVYGKVKTLAKMFGVCGRTIKRVRKLLEDNGIIKVYKTQASEENKTQKPNVWIFQKLELPPTPDEVKKENVTPPVTPEMSPLQDEVNADVPRAEEVKNEGDSLISLCSISKEELCNTVMRVEFLNQYVPEDFYQLCKPYFHVEDINDFWDTIVYNSSKFVFGKKWNELTDEENDYVKMTAISSISQLIKKAKGKKIRKEYGAYLFGTVKRKAKKYKKMFAEMKRTLENQAFFESMNESVSGEELDELGVY